MNSSDRQRVLFRELIPSVAAEQVWEYQVAMTTECRDVTKATIDALQNPTDFPSLTAAIVPGDRVAVAVDPSVPQLKEVIRGVTKAISQTDADGIDIVLWDEATDETVQHLRRESDPAVEITTHISDSRETLRYLAADESADPIYLNRRLVDADFILPIMMARPIDRLTECDLTGIFPTLSDSASRGRHRDARLSKMDGKANRDLPDLTWLLGVQLLLRIQASDSGNLGSMMAGTVEAMGKQMTSPTRLPDEFPPASPLVIASLDGNSQQQSWINAARAAEAASRFVTPGGTIVLWTEIARPPRGRLVGISEPDMSEPEFVPSEQCEFPPWDPTIGPAQALARLSDEYRILLHSQVDSELIEAMGFGTVETAEELNRLTQSFPACGVLQAAQFAGGTLVPADGNSES
jgi:hypothetical protein